MTLRSYSPSNVIVFVEGRAITTFDKVDVEYDDDRWSMSTSATGHTTRTRNESILGKISLDIPQTSIDTDSLMDVTSEQRVAGVVGLIPNKLTITIKDNWGQSMYTMTGGTLIKPQGSSFSKDPNNRTWEFSGLLDPESGFDTRGNTDEVD